MPLYGTSTYRSNAGDGVPGRTLPGIERVVPAGLEAVFEYNGLFMNIQRNYDYYKITSIDGLGDSDIRDTRDVNTDSDGETPFNAFLGGRTIVLTGEIITYSVRKMRDMQQALRAAFADVSQERALHFRMGDFNLDHTINCKKIGSIAMSEQQQNLRVSRDFQITLRASNPRFLSYYQKFFYALPDSSIGAPYELATLINTGNYWAEPIFRVYGPSMKTKLTNDTTGKSFTLTDIPYLDGVDQVYYDFNISQKTLRDQYGGNQWNSLADDSDYLLLQGMSNDNPTGENVIFVETDSPRIEISWYDSWV